MLHFLINQEIGTDAIELLRQFGKHCGKNVSLHPVPIFRQLQLQVTAKNQGNDSKGI